MKALLCRLFKVPPQPDPPPGDASRLRVFRAGRNYFRYKVVIWAFGQCSTLVGFLVAIVVMQNVPLGSTLQRVFLAIEVIAVISFLMQLVLSYFLVRLDFEMRWYIVTDRSLRIREGILNLREKTITFANIQNITVRQGPIQRLLGLSDLEVSTAGGGGSRSDPHQKHGQKEDLHTGYFRGVENAEEIRQTIGEGVRLSKGAGLGDREDDLAVHTASENDAVHGARAVLEELRSLRPMLLRIRGAR